MKLNLPLKHSLISLALIGLIGCTTTSQADFVSLAEQSTSQTQQSLLSELIQQTSEEQALNQHASNEQELDTENLQLTDLVNAPDLDLYIERALQNSPSLQQSITALKIAYAQQGVTSGDRLPTVDASFSGQADEGTNGSSTTETYTTDVTVGWELDLWQKLADTNSAALKDIATSQANLQGAQDLLVASVMRGWLDISLKQQLVDIETQRLVILENNEELVLERYRTGLGSLEELDNAKTSSASTQATLADYQEQLAQSRRALVLLTGQWSGESNEATLAELGSFPSIINPLDNMPTQDLAGRPDLQAAFFNIEAETLRADAAYKAMLPSISLSASLTDMAESPSEALLTGPLWSALGQVSAPLFQGGKLKAQAEIADLTTETSYWAYQETLLSAVNEVENAMGQESSLTLQQQHLTNALVSAQRSFTSYEEKYRQGLVDIFDLLTVQQQTYDLEAQLTQTIYNRLVNRIDLGLALGLGVSS
ncbi:TolC family protein [Vibrio splendidus]|uniref:TolC family protein n=1 Tax=Vibrio splendidus TaxID=29497 RepID=UPI000D344159|nr:TolC family protein [Vibrio splendidus]PTP44864.1 RND transporter [Vibrio splendidus]